MNDCIFCKIAKKEIPASIVFEDDTCVAFLDINPVKAGHTLLIPKEHHAYMSETPDELVQNMFLRAKKLMPGIKTATEADFIVLTVVGTDVPHFHIHLIPRKHNDGLAGFWPASKYKEGEMEETAETLRASIENLK